MLPSGGRRLVALIRRAAAGTNPRQPQPQAHAASLPHGYSSAPLASTPDTGPCLPAAANFVGPLASRGIRISSTAKADAVLALFRRHGFSDAQITRLLRLDSKILLIDPDKITRPKLEFFASLGFPADMLCSKPLLNRSLEKHIIPCVEFLRGILGTDANIRTAVSRHPHALLCNLENNMRPALQALRRHGLTEEAISKLLIFQVGVLAMSPDRIAGIFEDLKLLGLPITDSRFIYAFRAMSSLTRETWLRKVAVYRSLGVSETKLLKAFKTQPTILLISEDAIKKKLRFFLDELKLDLSDVLGHPVVIGYSLEKCILPRCSVLSVLMKEGKIKRDIKLLTALLGSTKVFSKRYVLRYADDVPDVVKAYEGKIKFEGFRDKML